ncbi:MAG: DUF485 domain-containing protein [Vulcanimicrobiaceae bacterium]
MRDIAAVRVREGYMEFHPTTGVPPPRSQAAWEAVEHSREFTELVRAKARFIVPAMIFFLVYYFTLPVLVGYAPALMEHKVIGNVNVAYLFALSQFAMTWIVMVLYARSAVRFDAQAATVIAKLEREDRA